MCLLSAFHQFEQATTHLDQLLDRMLLNCFHAYPCVPLKYCHTIRLYILVLTDNDHKKTVVIVKCNQTNYIFSIMSFPFHAAFIPFLLLNFVCFFFSSLFFSTFWKLFTEIFFQIRISKSFAKNPLYNTSMLIPNPLFIKNKMNTNCKISIHAVTKKKNCSKNKNVYTNNFHICTTLAQPS